MFEILLILSLSALGLGLWEYRIHKRNLKKIPIRIHVNGTRGKSSVARLIAAGLREGGIRTFAKTTGTLPRVIINDGSEYPVFRNGKANIIEQLRIVTFAARNKAEALVIECMALQPHLQALCELKLIKSTHGVITNSRADHLDVMGPSERDVALALLGTTPVEANLYTCEEDYPGEFEKVCIERRSSLHIVREEQSKEISDEEMSKFSYMEHKENVALALKVCADVGIDRDTALRGMHKVEPDSGAMSESLVNFFGRKIYFFNGFAANDPESTEQIWEKACRDYSFVDHKIMIINTRSDRPDRSRQLGNAIPAWTKADRYFLTGSGSYFTIKYARRNGMDPRLFINLEGKTTEKIIEDIISHCKQKTLIMGVGNIAGPGMEIVQYFANRSQLQSE